MAFKFNPITNRLDIASTSGGGGGGVSGLSGNSGGIIPPDGSGNINIIGSGGVSVSGSGNSLTISVASTLFTWSVITANQMASTLNGYFVNGGSVVDVTLPATSAVGDTFILFDLGGNTWSIMQGNGQQILFKNTATTAGMTGSLTSQLKGDTVTLVCAVANTTWCVTESIGSMVVV